MMPITDQHWIKLADELDAQVTRAPEGAAPLSAADVLYPHLRANRTNGRDHRGLPTQPKENRR
jgi:hypothetical protein